MANISPLFAGVTITLYEPVRRGRAILRAFVADQHDSLLLTKPGPRIGVVTNIAISVERLYLAVFTCNLPKARHHGTADVRSGHVLTVECESSDDLERMFLPNVPFNSYEIYFLQRVLFLMYIMSTIRL
jgi:hypothetical protein